MANRAYHQMLRRQRRKQTLEDIGAGICWLAATLFLLFI